MFSLVVDDFGVKCKGIQHAKNLKESLEHHHEFTVDWEGRFFLWHHSQLEIQHEAC